MDLGALENKITVLIDLDDTVWDLLSNWVWYLNKIHNLNVKVSDINDWDMQKFYPTLTLEEITEPLTWMSLWHHLRPKEDAIKYIKKINDIADIYFVTATDYRNIEYKIYLLQKYFPFIPINKLIITQNKNMIKGDIIIDDYINNLKDRDNLGILMTAMHNRNVDISNYPNIVRKDNWKDIYDYILKVRGILDYVDSI